MNIKGKAHAYTIMTALVMLVGTAVIWHDTPELLEELAFALKAVVLYLISHATLYWAWLAAFEAEGETDD